MNYFCCHLMYFVPILFTRSWMLLHIDVRFARAYHLRGLLFHAMGEHRYFCCLAADQLKKLNIYLKWLCLLSWIFRIWSLNTSVRCIGNLWQLRRHIWVVEILVLGTEEGSCRNLDYLLLLITTVVLERNRIRFILYIL